MSIVDEGLDDGVHVIGLAWAVGQDVEQARRGDRRDRARPAHRRTLLAVLRHERQIVFDERDAGRFVRDLDIAHARDFGVHARAAQILLADVLAGHRLDQRRSTEGHRALATHHRHEVGQPGMYAVPAAPGPTIAATSGTTPDMMTSSRNR